MQSSALQPLAMESNNFSYGFQLPPVCFTHHNIRSLVSLRYQYTCRKCSRHSPLTILILLMMCGDIESNPGPNTSQTYPCTPTTSHQRCGDCTGCQSVSEWYSRWQDLFTSHWRELRLRTSSTTAVYCLTPADAHSGRVLATSDR